MGQIKSSESEQLVRNRRRWMVADRLGFGMLLVAVATGPSPYSGITVHQAALALAALATLAVTRELWPYWRRSKVAWATLALVAFLAVRYGLALLEHPEGLPDSNPETSDLLRVSVLLPLLLGIWLRGEPLRLRWFTAAGLLGLILFLLHGVDWGALQAMDFSSRSMFGVEENPNRVGIVAALLLLAVPALGWGIGHWFWSTGYRWGVLAVVLVSAILAAALGLVLVVTASRGAWLAFVSGLMAWGILIVMGLWPELMRSLRSWLLTLVVAALGLGVFLGGVLHYSDTVSQRVDDVVDGVQVFLETPETALEQKGSTQYRIRLWYNGITLGAQRPLIGHGPHMNEAPATLESARYFGHLHNLYVEIFYAWGIVGLLLFLGGHMGLFGSAVSRHRQGGGAVFIHAYGLAALVAIAAYVMTTGPIYQSFFRMTVVFVATLVASAYWWSWFEQVGERVAQQRW